MLTDHATSALCAEPRGGDMTHLATGGDVAPSGLDGEGESDASLQFPGFAPRALRSRPSRASGKPSAVASIAIGDDDHGATPSAKSVVTLFMAAVAGEVIKGFHVAHEACRLLRQNRSDFEIGRHVRPAGTDRRVHTLGRMVLAV